MEGASKQASDGNVHYQISTHNPLIMHPYWHFDLLQIYLLDKYTLGECNEYSYTEPPSKYQTTTYSYSVHSNKYPEIFELHFM